MTPEDAVIDLAHWLVSTEMGDQRHRNRVAALGFLQLAPRAPELRLLHRGLDTWTGLGLIIVGIERLAGAVSAFYWVMP